MKGNLEWAQEKPWSTSATNSTQCEKKKEALYFTVVPFTVA